MRKYTGRRYTLLFLEEYYCFWKDPTVSGRTGYVSGRLKLFLEGQYMFLEGSYCFWKDKIRFWKDTNIEFDTFWSVIRCYGLKLGPNESQRCSDNV